MTSGAGKYRNDPTFHKVPFAGSMLDSLPGTSVEARFLQNNYRNSGFPIWMLYNSFPENTLSENTYLWGPKGRFAVGLHALLSDATAGCGGLPEYARVDGEKVAVVDPFMKALAQHERWPTNIFNTKTAHANAEENAPTIKAEVERSRQLSTPAMITVKAEGTPFDPATTQAFFTNPLILPRDVVATPSDPGNRRAGFYRHALMVPEAAETPQSNLGAVPIDISTLQLDATVVTGSGRQARLHLASLATPAKPSPQPQRLASLKAAPTPLTLEDLKGEDLKGSDYQYSLFNLKTGSMIGNKENVPEDMASFKKFMVAMYIADRLAEAVINPEDFRKQHKDAWNNNLECYDQSLNRYPKEAERLMEAAGRKLAELARTGAKDKVGSEGAKRLVEAVERASTTGDANKIVSAMSAGMDDWLKERHIDPEILGRDAKTNKQSLSGGGKITTATALELMKVAAEKHPNLFGEGAFHNHFRPGQFGSGSVKAAANSAYDPDIKKVHGVSGVYGVWGDWVVAMRATNNEDKIGDDRAEMLDQLLKAARKSIELLADGKAALGSGSQPTYSEGAPASMRLAL